ncbi:MAG: hypothetical protein Q4F56_01590 [Candidatus Saccharibacteria bacterium]|nr:hypothetical protein [Candidatus Saccharibacteria bacterium]
MNGEQMNDVSGTVNMQGASTVQPGMSFVASAQPQVGPNGMPMVQQVQAPATPKKDVSGLIKTIVIIALALITLTFIGLFIWMLNERNEAQSDLDGKIAVATAAAKDEQAQKDEAEFLEREKYPYKTFSGPADYGQLTFEYPKTWSVYVADPATAGGDFNAYLNPVQVETVGENTVNALRVTILNEGFDEVTQAYQEVMEDEKSDLTMVATTIGADNDIVANRYTGTIPDTELSGYIVTFKIRDKTAILQTDSVLFQEDYDKLLGTVTFND